MKKVAGNSQTELAEIARRIRSCIFMQAAEPANNLAVLLVGRELSVLRQDERTLVLVAVAVNIARQLIAHDPEAVNK